MAKTCETCKNCPLMEKANETLLKVVDYNYDSDYFKMCVDKNCVMKNNKNPNLICFIRHTYKSKNINWATVKKIYEENKDAYRNSGIE